MGKAIGAILGGIGCLWLAGMLLFGIGGAWIASNPETVVEAGLEASGIQDDIDRSRQVYCDQARDVARKLWDKAVDTHRIEEMQDMIDRANAEVEAKCGER